MEFSLVVGEIRLCPEKEFIAFRDRYLSANKDQIRIPTVALIFVYRPKANSLMSKIENTGRDRQNDIYIYIYI